MQMLRKQCNTIPATNCGHKHATPRPLTPATGGTWPLNRVWHSDKCDHMHALNNKLDTVELTTSESNFASSFKRRCLECEGRGKGPAIAMLLVTLTR